MPPAHGEREPRRLKGCGTHTELSSMGSFEELLFGGVLGVAIVVALWLIVALIDDLQRQAHSGSE